MRAPHVSCGARTRLQVDVPGVRGAVDAFVPGWRAEAADDGHGPVASAQRLEELPHQAIHITSSVRWYRRALPAPELAVGEVRPGPPPPGHRPPRTVLPLAPVPRRPR